jgi:membrane protein
MKFPFFWLNRIYQFFYALVKAFFDDDCYTKASALAFYSFLSIVPLLAVLFAITNGVGLQKALESEISARLIQQPEVAEKLIEFAHSWLKSIKGGVIAAVGIFTLLWTVLGLLNSVENTLNSIWKVKTGRSYIHKFRDYFILLFIAPIFLIVSSSINIFFTTEITETAGNNAFMEAVTPFLLSILSLFPYFLFWLLFTFIYAFVPNTRVQWSDAIIAGVLAGTTFQVWQWFYIQFQVNLSSYGTIYGSLAALPLFLIWLQTSWLIVLAGAEMAVALGGKNLIFNQIIEKDF